MRQGLRTAEKDSPVGEIDPAALAPHLTGHARVVYSGVLEEI